MAAQILTQIHNAFKTRSCESLTFTELDISVSAEILKNLLGQKDICALKLSSGLLTLSAILSISGALRACDTFVAAFEGSQKTPDLCYSPQLNGVKTEFPTIVLKVGWSQSEFGLKHNAQLWLEGSAGTIQVVFLFKLFYPNVQNEIKTTLHLCRLDNNVVVLDTYVFSSSPYLIFLFVTSN
ncbi:hypothetical protein B9Z19DRAFT_1158441 [Tuber borchii]|uniref:Uncharacterized protein n=1 Tax=Tuber borchii TaxID=42251 RepID=A0A2T6ZG40_TUBBO|nr:hypothetical protein B9Z19DRAFT_1158441 [Tuber borchii]